MRELLVVAAGVGVILAVLDAVVPDPEPWFGPDEQSEAAGSVPEPGEGASLVGPPEAQEAVSVLAEGGERALGDGDLALLLGVGADALLGGAARFDCSLPGGAAILRLVRAGGSAGALPDGQGRHLAAALLTRGLAPRPPGTTQAQSDCREDALLILESMARTGALGPGPLRELAGPLVRQRPPGEPGTDRLVRLLVEGMPEDGPWPERVADLVRDQGLSPAARDAACEALARRRLLPPLLQPGADARARACRVHLASDRVNRELILAHGADPDPVVRAAAAAALERVGRPVDVPGLLARAAALPPGGLRRVEQDALLTTLAFLIRTEGEHLADLLPSLSAGGPPGSWQAELALRIDGDEPESGWETACDYVLRGEAVPPDDILSSPASPVLCLAPGWRGSLPTLGAPGLIVRVGAEARIEGELRLAAPTTLVGAGSAQALRIEAGAAGSRVAGLTLGAVRDESLGSWVLGGPPPVGPLFSSLVVRVPDAVLRRGGSAWLDVDVARGASAVLDSLRVDDTTPWWLGPPPGALPPGRWIPLLGAADEADRALVFPLVAGGTSARGRALAIPVR